MEKWALPLYLHAPMVVTYYIKLFRMEADRQRYVNVSSPSRRKDKNEGHN